MAVHWESNLRNGPGDIVFDTLLSISIIITYAFQIHRVYSRGSTQGISPHCLLFNTILSNVQLAKTLMLGAYAYPDPDTRVGVLQLIADGRLKGAAALGGVLGIIQVALQWICSVIIIVLYEEGPDNGATRGILSSKAGIAILAFIHAALFLFPAVLFTLPKPEEINFGVDLYFGVLQIVHQYLSPIAIVLMLGAQYSELRRSDGKPEALSVLSLGLQSMVMAIVAIRWMMRIGVLSLSGPDNQSPANPWYFVLWWLDGLKVWYDVWFVSINYVLYAIASAILFFAYSSAGRWEDRHASRPETELLLG